MVNWGWRGLVSCRYDQGLAGCIFLPEFMWLSCEHAGAQEERKIDQRGAESLAGGADEGRQVLGNRVGQELKGLKYGTKWGHFEDYSLVLISEPA